MNTLRFGLFATAMALMPLVTLADKEVVDGVEWSYGVDENGQAIISGIPDRQTGAIKTPLTLGGCPVTGIGDYAFYECHYLTSLTISDGVSKIGEYAFYGCSWLETVTIPEGVKSIDECTFYGCERLRSVTIPSSVTNIGRYAFYGCFELSSMAITQAVTIGEYAFAGCRNLGLSLTLSRDMTSIGPGSFSSSGLLSVIIPEGVTNICEDAFSYCRLKSVTIPSNVETIGAGAFRMCTSLTSLTISEGVASIGPAAFAECHNLKSVEIPSSVMSIPTGAFSSCNGLESVTISEGVMSIGANAFYWCTGITSVTIPLSVKSIEAGAFENCRIQVVYVPEKPQGCVTSYFGNQMWYQKIGEPISYEWSYSCDGNQAKITGVKPAYGDIVIPSSCEGLKVSGIDDRAFYGCVGIKSVIITEGVERIGSQTFQNCRCLKAVTLPASLMSVGDGAFRGCDRFETATVLDGATRICASAFWGCDCLKTVAIPSSVTNIENRAFEDCVGLEEVTLPEEVTCIGDRAFYGCRGLNAIEIPSGVRSIGEDAFSGCDGLMSMTIPSSVTSIGEGAFSYCDGLTSVTIPSSITSIGAYVFSSCGGLTSVTIPSSVTNVGRYAFSGCSGLTSVEIPSSATSIGNSAFEGCSGLESVSIPEGVTSIGNYAFRGCSGLTSVALPSSVTSIGRYAFSGCGGLTSVVIPTSVTSIGEYAFSGCSGLTSVEIPSSATSIGNSAFEGCSGLESVSIPEGVTSIGNYAFRGCSGLTSVALPSSVTSIGRYAFSGCGGLTSVAIPLNVTSIEEGAFYGCDGLSLVTIPSSVTSIGYRGFFGCSGLTSVEIPSSVTSIGSSAFEGCSGLTSIEIPSSVTSIGSSAFEGCSGLTSVTIPSSVMSLSSTFSSAYKSIKEVTLQEGVTRIGYAAFEGCSGLTSVTIPSSVTSIGSHAFRGCEGLTSVTIPSSVTSIGDAAFEGCSGLADADGFVIVGGELMDYFGDAGSVIIPDGVTSIGQWAFSGCSGLTSVTLPKGVTHVGYQAFYACGGLTSVTMPSSVTSIGSWAFEGCNGLTVLVFEGDMPTVESSAFSGTALQLVRVSMAANGWGSFLNGIPVEYFDAVDMELRVVDIATGSEEIQAIAHGIVTNAMTWIAGKVYVVDGALLVGKGGHLTIQSGAVVKFTRGSRLIVRDGMCTAYGAVFTHIADDEVGGDTNGDGDATKPFVGAYTLAGNIYEDDATEERYSVPQTLTSSISGMVRLKGHKVYLANSSITVNSDAMLTIQPGAIIKFASGCSLMVNGTLDAQGTRAAPIVFTSAKDDEWGGDTNGDGDKTRPEGGNWTGLYVYGTANLDYCYAMYAAPSNERGNIECESGGRLTMNGCTVAHSLYDGVWNWGGTIKITNSIFFDCGNAVCPYQGSTTCDNCVMFECNYGYMDWSHWVGGTFKNCIFYGMGMNWSDTDSAAEFQAHSTVKNCCFYNPEGYSKRSCTKNGVDGNIWGDPKFVDPDNGDFRIAADSPCVDAGDAAVAPELDYWGQPRKGAPDIGIYEVTEGLQSPVDLVPEQVTMDPTAEPGGKLHATWTMRNIGSQETSGSWRDKLVLTDATGVYSIDLGTVISSGTVAAGGSVACSAAVAVPATAEGEWHVAVHANCERDIFEGANTTNNVAVSAGIVVVAMAAAEPGAGMSGTATAKQPGVGKFAFSGEPMIGRIDAPEGTIVYFGNGFVPTADSFTARTVCGVDGGIIGIPAGTATGYVTMVSPNGKEVAYALSFESGALAVKGVSPARVPSSGMTGLIVTGANFDENCSVELTVDGNPGAAYVSEKVSLVSATQLSLTVDCSKLQAGKGYAVTVTSADGAKATCAGAFSVEAIPPKAELKASLDVPSAVRQGRTVTCWIDYENTGNVDMAVPVFEIVSEGQIFKVDGNVHSNSVKVMGLSAEAPHGTLRPGEPQRLGVQVTCMAADLKWQLKSYHVAQEGAKTAALSLRELYDDDWVIYHSADDDATVAGLRKTIGKTWADYYANLGAWISANNVTALDYLKVRDAFAQMQYAAVAGAHEDRAASAARKMSPKLMSPQCNHVRLASHWKEAGNGSVFRLCPNCKNFYQVMEHPSAGVYTRLEDDGFDSEGKNVYVICHGNANSVAEGWILDMGKALLSRNQADGVEAEVLAVNWGEGAMTLLAQPYTSAGRIPGVADEAQGELVALGIRPEQTTLIGHSHGGHVAANIACHYGLKGKFKRYVGLDTSTTDNLVHSLWKLWGYIVPSANSALWYGDWTPSNWMREIAKFVEDGGVEFYKSTFNMSLEETNQLFGDWNFALFDRGDFLEEGAVGLGPKADNGFIGATSKELSRHSLAYQWYTETIQNKGGFSDLGYNFEGDKSWKRLHNGFEVPRPPKKHYAGMICGNNVLELAPRESNRRMWNYETLVVNGQDASTLPKSLFRLQECLFYARDYSVSAQIESGVDVKQLDGLPSGTTITVSVENNANNYSIPYKQFLSGKKDCDYMDNSGGGRVTVWLVDAESLGLSDQPYDIHDLSYRLWDNANENVREIGNNSKWQFDDSSVFALPGDESPKTAKIPISFSNEIFGPDRPLLRTDESGKVVMRNVLLVIGAGCNYPEWERDLSHKNYDLDPTDNYIIKKLVAVPQDTWAVISRRPAKTNALKAMSFSASYASASAFAPQLSENALKPGEVISVTAAKDGTWSIDLDGSESFSLTDDTLDVLSFTLPEYGATKGTVTLNGKGARYDMPWTKVSGQLPSDVDADGNPVCEGERYTVKLTVYTQGGDEASVSCVLDVRYAMDEDEGEDEDATTSTSPKSCDPNEMTGPEGVGEERTVKPGDWMTYTIYFENKADAEAAAAMVTVTNPLSEWLDWESFEMQDVAFDSQTDTGLLGKSSGTSSITMDGTNTSVRTEVEVDPATGVATWFLRIVDPDGDADGWPLDPYAGFLPPNDAETHCGEGRISYRIRVREDAPSGVRIDNSATIVFDYNPPIETDPAWWNTVGSATAEGAAGEYVSYDLVEDLGIEIPSDVDYAAGDKVTVKVEGLAKGLKVAQDKTSKAWIVSGVPTEEIDFETQPMYARVTVTYKDKTKGDKGKVETLQPIVLSITTPEPSVLTAGVLNQVYGPADIATLWPEVADAKVNPTEWSFKGWPSGIKYNATAKDANWSYKDADGKSVKTTASPYTVYGQPTKAGEYPITATWKHKLEDNKTTVSETFSAVLTVWGDVEDEDEFRYIDQAYVATATKALDATWKSFSGLPTGIKYTTKLIAADTKKGTPEYPAYSLYGTPTKAGAFAVTATKVDPDDAKTTVKETFLWKVAPPDAPEFALDTGTAPIEDLKAQIVQGANQNFAIAASEGAKMTASGLPTGLKLVQDKTTGLYSVEGVATKPGEYFVTFKTVLNGVTTVTTTAFTVKGNPFAATYCGYACARPAAGASNRLAVAEVSVAAAGTVKLTYTEGKTKYTASVKSFGWDDATGKGTAEGLVLKVSSADKKLGYGDRKAIVTFEDCGIYLKAKLVITDANGSALMLYGSYLFETVKATEIPLPASQTFVFQNEDGGIVDAIATVSVAYDANKATAAFSGKLFDGTAVKVTVPVIRVYDEGSSWDYSFAPFLVIAKDGTVYCFNEFYCWDGGYVDWVAENGKDLESAWADYAEYTHADKKFAELVPETGTFVFGWGSDAEVVGADTESFAFKVATDAKGNPAGVEIYDSDPQEGEKPLATVTAKVGKLTGAISVSFTSKKGDKAKYAVELVWRDDQLFAGHVTRTWKELVGGKSANLTASGTAEVK